MLSFTFPHSFLPSLGPPHRQPSKPGPEATSVCLDSYTGGVGEQALWDSGEMPCGVSWMLSGPHARVW